MRVEFITSSLGIDSANHLPRNKLFFIFVLLFCSILSDESSLRRSAPLYAMLLNNTHLFPSNNNNNLLLGVGLMRRQIQKRIHCFLVSHFSFIRYHALLRICMGFVFVPMPILIRLEMKCLTRKVSSQLRSEWWAMLSHVW